MIRISEFTGQHWRTWWGDDVGRPRNWEELQMGPDVILEIITKVVDAPYAIIATNDHLLGLM